VAVGLRQLQKTTSAIKKRLNFLRNPINTNI
jgi:hypothetical protein